jgi:hypothetical protein
VCLLENQETPGYLKQVIRRGFLDRWNGLTPHAAAQADVDTVTGATLTSRAIREGVQRRLRIALAAEGEDPPDVEPGPATATTWRDGGTLFLLAAALGLCFTKSRWHPGLRLALAFAAIGWIGFLAGSLVSQVMLAGWLRGGVSWGSAVGTWLLALAALAVPVATGRPFYCTYLCPHGYAQELLGRISPWRRPVPGRWVRWLAVVPGLALLGMIALLLTGQSLRVLSPLEPFAAYQPLKSGAVPIVLAATSLLAALFVQRPWCRFGCATGALLRFLQRPPKGARFGVREWLAGAAAAAAVLAAILKG